LPITSADELIEWLAPGPGERVLDAGCGLGLLTARLARNGALVTGLEILPHLQEQFRLSAPGCEFVAGDLLHWHPSHAFDAVFAHASLNWIRPPDRAARRLFQALRRGGRLAVFLGGASQVARELETYYDPRPAEYEKLLRKAGFEVERWEEAHAGFLMLARRP
jgi:trans-aconitate methyltransferase